MPRRAWMCLNYATGSPRLLNGLTLTATFTLLFVAIFAPSVARRPWWRNPSVRPLPSLHFAPDRVSHLFTHSFHLSFVSKYHLNLTPTSQLKFLGILPPATSLTMHVGHFS